MAYAGKSSGDGMRKKEQHESKERGWACKNHNMCNPSLNLLVMGVTHVVIVASLFVHVE